MAERDQGQAGERLSDEETGVTWVHVGREAAHGHPKGRPGGPMWLVIGYFALLALGWAYGLMAGQVPLGMGLAGVLVPAALASGLFLRIPYAMPVTVVVAALTILYHLASIRYLNAVGMGNVVVLILIIFYLLEGDRPNLIYRHRYRSYPPAGGGTGKTDTAAGPVTGEQAKGPDDGSV